jgi:hypothetical protein
MISKAAAAAAARAAAAVAVSALVAALLLSAAPRDARADDDDALVRVLADQANVHTGPGFSYRVIYVAARGEVLPAIGRSTQDNWFRVQLPDGTYGWLLGDQVFPLDVDTQEAHRGPSIWNRMGGAVFSPSPLLENRIGLTFSAGTLGGDSMFLFRPSVVLEPHVSLEGFVGESVGNQLDVLYFGGGFNAYLWPASPVTPFVAVAGGGARGRKKADQFTIVPGNYDAVNVGGGLLIAFKKRITLRGDVRHYVVFDANHTQQLQEFSGAFSVHF